MTTRSEVPAPVEHPDRLSFVHSVRVVQRRVARYGAIPPGQRKAFHQAILDEILEERVVSRRSIALKPILRRARYPSLSPGR